MIFGHRIFGHMMFVHKIFDHRIFGHGTLSGDLLPHPSFAQPPINNSEHYTYHPIDIRYEDDGDNGDDAD